MPLAFGTILGGMTTLIGTPPNLIVSSFRNDAGLGHFSMFDFTPVGLAVASVGVIFIIVLGLAACAERVEATSGESFDPGAYVTEVRYPREQARRSALTLRGFEDEIEDSHAVVVGLFAQ